MMESYGSGAQRRRSGLEGRPIAGDTVDPKSFVFNEFDRDFPPLAFDVLQGRAIGLIIHDYLTAEACDRISMNFDRNSGLRDRDDTVPGRTIGVDLFGKDRAEYLAALPRARADVDELFRGS